MDTSTGTEIISNTRTELMTDKTAEQEGTGGLLQIGEIFKGWKITSQLDVRSLEAEIYKACKDGQDGIVKYYRMVTKPKEDVLKKIQDLNHDDIIKLYKYGEDNGRLYEIMEYAAGGTLDSRNNDGSYKYLPLSEDDVLGVCEELINGFKKCHDLGIIHRDIKPGNIFYRKCSNEPDENGKYKGNDAVIGDFGISSVMDEGEQYRKTRTATRTSAYAAPEINYQEIDGKFDYYSLGVTLWELATGKEPYRDDEGYKPDSRYILQLATEGTAADNLLRIKPQLSHKLQRLIRGLLVVDTKHRWGYEQVRDHLDGKEVDIYVEKREFGFKIGDKHCTNLDELAEAILKMPNDIEKKVYDGQLAAVLRGAKYSDLSKQIEKIAEEYSAKENERNGIYKIAWTISSKAPCNLGNGYSVKSVEDIILLLKNAPETMLPLLRDKNSWLYIYLDVLDRVNEANEIKTIDEEAGNAELISKALVILSGRRITPYQNSKYKNFTLDTPENLKDQKIPDELKKRILTLIAEKSCEGFIYPWIDLHLKERGVKEYSPSTWNELIDLFSIKAA